MDVGDITGARGTELIPKICNKRNQMNASDIYGTTSKQLHKEIKRDNSGNLKEFMSPK